MRKSVRPPNRRPRPRPIARAPGHLVEHAWDREGTDDWGAVCWSSDFCARCLAGQPVSLSSLMVAFEVSDHNFFWEADLPESHGCPRLFLPNRWSRRVKSALCQAADTCQRRARRPARTRRHVRGQAEAPANHQP